MLRSESFHHCMLHKQWIPAMSVGFLWEWPQLAASALGPNLHVGSASVPLAGWPAQQRGAQKEEASSVTFEIKRKKNKKEGERKKEKIKD